MRYVGITDGYGKGRKGDWIRLSAFASLEWHDRLRNVEMRPRNGVKGWSGDWIESYIAKVYAIPRNLHQNLNPRKLCLFGIFKFCL